ncbi:zinc finger protein 830-like [Macrobrachium nipponense]|uniref:zinc finger protein 830-like n=1 Tax=Macrobrachium nipponense TaxID=159736 RepID=UPI0030C80A8F
MSLNKGRPQDIKKLMQEQMKNKAITKQIDSPYAKYNSRGQLMCIVCGTIVKSAIIWQAHVIKRSHLENLASLQKKQKQINSQAAKSNHADVNVDKKRPASPPTSDAKKGAFSSTNGKPKGKLGLRITLHLKEVVTKKQNKPVPDVAIKSEPGVEQPVTNGVPDGFFDEDKPPRTEEESMYKEKLPKPKDPPKPNTTEILPEGFFDDPVADAKARKVEYKDKDAEEWMSFMKEVSAAEQQSRMIIEEDKEEAALTTQIEQANEQIACLERVVELDKRKNTQLQERGAAKKDSDNDEDSSDEEFAPVIWRTKNSLI